jgi:DNA-binding XRE family transcriptional regulator
MRDPDELAAAMLEYRRATDQTQAEAAEAAGILPKTWQSVERGEVHPRLKTRARIEALLPPRTAEAAVRTIVEHERKTRPMPFNSTTHRHDLSTGLIKCQVLTTSALPAQAYAVLAELVEALQAADTKLQELVADQD